MTKRKQVIKAGALVIATICTPPAPRDSEHVRRAKSRVTTEVRRLLNMTAARRRLELLLAANFAPQDFHVTLTYRDADLPASRAAALKTFASSSRSSANTVRRVTCRCVIST